jgi:dihydropteroate synthase
MFTLNCKGRLLVIDEPIVMGILNTTPDSFYSKSRVTEINVVLETAGKMIEDGASILDLGGQSTRPGSQRVSATEEMERVIPFVEAIRKTFPDCFISVDSFYANVVMAAVNAGADIVNDISAGSIDNELVSTVASLKVPYVAMHIKGDPQTMQKNAVYDNVVLDVFDFLNKQISELKARGVNDIIIDPGFGFAKTIEHNFQLINNLAFFKQLDRPILVGLSRKATVYKTLGISADEALNGTTVLNTMCVLNGASILRVHDVKEAKQLIELTQAATKKESFKAL